MRVWLKIGRADAWCTTGLLLKIFPRALLTDESATQVNMRFRVVGAALLAWMSSSLGEWHFLWRECPTDNISTI